MRAPVRQQTGGLANVATLLTGLGDAAKHAVGHLFGVHTAALRQLAQQTGQQFHGRHAVQGAGLLGGAARRAQRLDDDRKAHKTIFNRLK